MDDQQRKKKAEMVALFRYGIIGDIVHLPHGSNTIGELIRKKADADYEIPGTSKHRIQPETIRDWLKNYRKGGFDALLPIIRRDAGQSRMPKDVADALLGIKEENLALTVPQVLKLANEMQAIPTDLEVHPSSVYRLFARHGIRKKSSADKESAGSKDHRRFAFQKAGELWMSDVMHGPAVVVDGKSKRKTYLIAFLDDATRVIPHATFTLAENTASLLLLLKQAILRRGIPRRLFVDNGSNFRSHHLSLVCAKLGISLIHARPYHPEAKGKQERWFRTARIQLLPLLTPSDLSSLDALNRRLWAYIEGEYHRTPHRSLEGDCPLDRWAKTADEVKFIGPELDLDDLFLFETKRRVHKDRTVSLDGVLYEVDASLVNETVILRYDPSRPGRSIQVWFRGRREQDAKVLDAYANCFVKRDTKTNLSLSKPPKVSQSALRLSELGAASKDDGHDEEGF